MNTAEQYASTADELANRILSLIPAHPEIMTLASPFDLFKVDGFYCSDLSPSLFQASHALAAARRRYKAGER